MVRLRVAEALEERGWTAYRLAQEAGLSLSMAYRLARPGGRFKQIASGTLDALCRTLHCAPGDLIERVPDQAARRKRAK